MWLNKNFRNSVIDNFVEDVYWKNAEATEKRKRQLTLEVNVSETSKPN
jgi:hypothetical protein